MCAVWSHERRGKCVYPPVSILYPQMFSFRKSNQDHLVKLLHQGLNENVADLERVASK